MTVTQRLVGDLPVRSAAAAAAEIPADATLVVSGFGSVAYPKAVPEALARSGRDLSLTVVSGGSTGDEIDTALVEVDGIARRFAYQARTASRGAINRGEIAYHDRHVGQLGDEVRFGGLVDADVAVVEAIAVGEDWLIPSMAIGPTPDFVAAADRLVVEVNDVPPLGVQRFHDVYRRALPPNREPIPITEPADRIGDSRIEFDPGQLEAVVRTSRSDTAYDFRDPTEDDRTIAKHLASFLSAEADRNPMLAQAVTLQFGVGSLGNALMGELPRMDFGDRTVAYFGEVIQDGLVDMIDEGEITTASATALAVTPAYHDRLFDEFERYAEHVVLRPGYVSNDPGLIDRLGVVAVNSALEVDVYGHVNSTHVGGTDVVTGIGGSGDLNRNSHLAITALGSTAGDGSVSRIRPMVPHVDHTEHDVDVVITEHGVADLRGLSPRERADTIVAECAHPDVRSDLRRYLDRAGRGGGHIPHDLESAFSWRE